MKMGKTYKGIDVSVHNGGINWAAVKNSGVQYAILRAGYGKSTTQKDANFEVNYTNAKKAGIAVGCYWYCYATTPQEAIQEAESCLAVIKGKKFEYPIYYDVEENRTYNSGNTSNIIRAFCERLEAAGYYTGIYASSSTLHSYFDADIKNKYNVWVAHWGVKSPSYTGNYGMWQYSATGNIPGITGNVDLDTSYLDFEKIIKSNNLNGYTSAEPPVQEKENMTVTINYKNKTYKGTVTEV